jgi:hypothetical protein
LQDRPKISETSDLRFSRNGGNQRLASGSSWTTEYDDEYWFVLQAAERWAHCSVEYGSQAGRRRRSMIQRDLKSGPRPLNGECSAIAAARRVRPPRWERSGTVPRSFELADAELIDHRSERSASDIVQESLLDAVADFSQFEGITGDELRVWLRRIVCNRSVDVTRRYRHADKRDVAREPPLDERLQNELAVPDRTPAQVSRTTPRSRCWWPSSGCPSRIARFCSCSTATAGRSPRSDGSSTARRPGARAGTMLLLLQQELKEHA